MSCEQCHENYAVDGIVPDCKTDAGCLIPPLPENGKRVLSLRSMRVELGDLIDSGTVCRAFESEFGPLDWHDLSLLAAVEDVLNSSKESNDGERR